MNTYKDAVVYPKIALLNWQTASVDKCVLGDSGQEVGRRLSMENCQIHIPLAVVKVLVEPPSCCWHLLLVWRKPKGRRQQKKGGTENRKEHRVWKSLTEKAGGLLESRRHSQIDRAWGVKRRCQGLAEKRDGSSGEQGEIIGRLRLGDGGGRGEEVGNSQPKKEWWSAAKQRLWELVWEKEGERRIWRRRDSVFLCGSCLASVEKASLKLRRHSVLQALHPSLPSHPIWEFS